MTKESESGMSQTPTDPRRDYDRARASCPVQRQDKHVTVYGHPEVCAVVGQPEVYSSGVSRFLQLPNGLDGAEHRQWRGLIDPYLNAPSELQRIEVIARDVMAELLTPLGLPTTLDAVGDLGARYAVRVQLRWLGWDAGLEDRLLAWMGENRLASRSGDLDWTARVAAEFDAIIRGELERHRSGQIEDTTARLMNEQLGGRPLKDEELVSILRNWTAGDLSSLALCVGVIVHFLATHPDLQTRLRAGVSIQEFDAALDEILRIDDPFVSNRRLVTGPSELGGERLGAGDVVHVNWTAANRDPRVFADPDRFDPVHNQPHNLVYGAGTHACPGRRLSTLELRVFTQELLRATGEVQLAGSAERELPPVGGYAVVPVALR